MSTAEETKTVVESSSVEALNGSVLIACKSIFSSSASVGIVPRDSLDGAFGNRSVGEMLKTETGEFSLVVKAVDQANRQVTVAVRRNALSVPAKPKEAPLVTTRETGVSCQREIDTIVRNAFEGQKIQCKWENFYRLIITTKGWLLRSPLLDISVGSSIHNGIWPRLDIKVMHAAALEPAESIGRSYSDKTGMEVSVSKHF